MNANISYEDLCKKIKSNEEFNGKPKQSLIENNEQDKKESPELAAFRILI